MGEDINTTNASNGLDYKQAAETIRAKVRSLGRKPFMAVQLEEDVNQIIKYSQTTVHERHALRYYFYGFRDGYNEPTFRAE